MRRTGSTALNLAYVACGRFCGYWAYDNWAWDTTAGACLVREAGGAVASADGTPFDPFRSDLVATNGKVAGGVGGGSVGADGMSEPAPDTVVR